MEIDGVAPGPSTGAWTSALREGIVLILSRWWSLQFAVDNESGGRNSRCRAEQLVDEIFDWFTRSRELYIDDLEDMLESCMDSLGMMGDNSTEEVAEILMVLHEECLKGNYKYVENLRALTTPVAGSQVLNDEEDSSSDDEGDEGQGGASQSKMMDEGVSLPNSNPAATSLLPVQMRLKMVGPLFLHLGRKKALDSIVDVPWPQWCMRSFVKISF